MSDEAKAETKLIPGCKVYDRTSLSRTTIWRMVRAGEFPPPVRVSANRIAWPESVVSVWIASRMEAA
jgi:prophage regulatory protein